MIEKLVTGRKASSPRGFLCEDRALSWELAAAHAVRCYHYFMPVLAILGRARARVAA